MNKSNSVPETDTARPLKLMLASEEIINLLAQAPNVLDFKPSEEARKRVWDLIAREKQGILTEEEKHELDHYAQIEHLMRLMKAQAHTRLKQSS